MVSIYLLVQRRQPPRKSTKFYIERVHGSRFWNLSIKKCVSNPISWLLTRISERIDKYTDGTSWSSSSSVIVDSITTRQILVSVKLNSRYYITISLWTDCLEIEIYTDMHPSSWRSCGWRCVLQKVIGRDKFFFFNIMSSLSLRKARSKKSVSLHFRSARRLWWYFSDVCVEYVDFEDDWNSFKRDISDHHHPIR